MRGRIPAARAALWTLRALVHARRQLRREGMRRLELPAPPGLPESAVGGVLGALRLPASCLERAVVLQRWHAAHGHPRDVVIGVAGSRLDFRAHAWLDGDDASLGDGYRELSRLPAP